MEIKYDAYYITENGTRHIIHGVLDDGDLAEAVKRKEDRETMGGSPVELEDVTWEGISI